jgi:hypothetical protein
VPTIYVMKFGSTKWATFWFLHTVSNSFITYGHHFP